MRIDYAHMEWIYTMDQLVKTVFFVIVILIATGNAGCHHASVGPMELTTSFHIGLEDFNAQRT